MEEAPGWPYAHITMANKLTYLGNNQAFSFETFTTKLQSCLNILDQEFALEKTKIQSSLYGHNGSDGQGQDGKQEQLHEGCKRFERVDLATLPYE